MRLPPRHPAADLTEVTALPRPRFLLFPGTRLPGAGGVGWRLVGANNRELGRGTRTYPDAASAVAAIDRVRELAESGTAYVTQGAGRRGWRWRLDTGGTPLVVSGRDFRQERAARHNLEQFRQEAPSAPVVGGVPEPAVPGRAGPRRHARD